MKKRCPAFQEVYCGGSQQEVSSSGQPEGLLCVCVGGRGAGREGPCPRRDRESEPGAVITLLGPPVMCLRSLVR